MDQSPAAFFDKADATENGDRGATGFRGFGDFSVDCLLLTGSGGGGENLLPTYVLCHVSRCTPAVCRLVAEPRAAIFAVVQLHGYAMLGALWRVVGGLTALDVKPLAGVFDLRLDAGEVDTAQRHHDLLPVDHAL